MGTRINNLRSFEDGMNNIKIENASLVQAARRDELERDGVRREAIRLFNGNSESLYDAPGRLAIDITETGYNFHVEIQRDGSEGIDKMKIFCYDLMLAQLWSQKSTSPNLLIHDSTLYDGVDERQVAHALQLAEVESRERKFQYICMLNSDNLPNQELLGKLELDKYIRTMLTDQVEGSLLGVRY